MTDTAALAKVLDGMASLNRADDGGVRVKSSLMVDAAAALRAAEARIKEAEVAMNRFFNLGQEAGKRADAAEARIKALETWLNPFGLVTFSDADTDEQMVAVCVTAGYLRAVRAALSPAPEAEKIGNEDRQLAPYAQTRISEGYAQTRIDAAPEEGKK